MQDSQIVDMLSAEAELLPPALLTFAECLARLREKAEGEEKPFVLTTCQRNQAHEVLGGLARGLSGKKLEFNVNMPTDLEELAARVHDLKEQKKALEEELTQASEELVTAIGIGATVRGPDWKVRIGEPRLSMKVLDAKELPEEFLSLQPNRKAILDHVKEAAEVPAGVGISESKATVYFGKL